MKDILLTRWMHWRKHWIGLLFWLVLPIVATILVNHLAESTEKEAKVPIGIVVEEETPLSAKLLEEISENPSLQVQRLKKTNALHLLRIHKLDSVFVINKGYEEQIRKGNRDQLVSGYHSDLSFAYSPVKEAIISLVQQETSRSKAAYTVKQLANSVGSDHQWTWDEIIHTSKQVQKEENLFLSTFTFLSFSKAKTSDDTGILDIWSIWVLLNLLITFMLFDWIIKEKQHNVFNRFSFMRFSYQGYLICNAILYFILQFCFDLAAGCIFHIVLKTSFSLSMVPSLFTLQLMLTTLAFMLALFFNNTYLYYSVAIAVFLLFSLIGDAIIPLDHLIGKYPWLTYINPFYDFLHGDINFILPPIFILIIATWYFFKQKASIS